MDSKSENHALALLKDEHRRVYSVGISTAGVAEIRMAKALAAREVIATTIDPRGALFASNKIKQAVLSERIEVKIEDVRDPLPYPDGFFDFIYARLVLHYLDKDDLQRALRELYRVLRSRGQLFVVVRSTKALEAQGKVPSEETGLTTYTYEDGRSTSRFFHTNETIETYMHKAGFQIEHIKNYDEQLCEDFQRLVLSKQVDSLIEVFASNSES